MSQNKDLHRFNVGMNKDDSPEDMQPGEYSDGLNVRIGSSEEQQGIGIMETLQGEVEITINVSAAYYGGAIGGDFIYSGFEEVTIGNQVWMKRNLDTAYPGSRVYDNDEDNRAIYGGLYNHNHLLDPFLIPTGWRVPTEADVDELLTYLGGAMLAGGILKEYDTPHWVTPNTGSSDYYGFTMLPGGMFDALFSLLGLKGSFWILDSVAPEPPVALAPTVIGATFFVGQWTPSVGADGYLLSVTDDPTFVTNLPGYDNLDIGNVVNISVTGLVLGTTYYYYLRAYNDVGQSDISNIIAVVTADDSIIIGTQIWKTKNVTINLPNSYVYDNDEGNRILYGGMYTFDLFDEIEAAHPGWLVPTATDWQTLIAFVGDATNAGGILKAIAGGWDAPNTGAIDTYAFESRSTGYYASGVFANLGQYGLYWSKTPGIAGTGVYFLFSYNNDDLIESVTSDTTSIAVRLIAAYAALDPPVATDATSITETTFDANWLPTTGATGYRLTVAEDATFLTIVPGYNNLDVGNVITYSVAGLDPGHQYFYRLTAYNPGYTSGLSNTITVGMLLNLQVEARGLGTGVATLVLEVSDTMVLTLDGTARFYSDPAGTLNESTTRTLTATGSLVQTFIRCPSGISNLTFSNTFRLLRFGNAVSLGATNPVWGRSTGGSYDSNTPRLIASNFYFPNCYSIGIAYPAIVTFITHLNQLPEALTRACLGGTGSIAGTLANIPAGCTLLYSQSNTISGNINTLTSAMAYMDIGGSNTISGDIADLADGFVDFRISGNNTLSGDIADLPISLGLFQVYGLNTTHGDLQDIGANMDNFYVGGINTITGDVSDLKEGLLTISIAGNNTIFGDVETLPTTLTQLQIVGFNTISGNVIDIPVSITFFLVDGLNTITGDIANFPAGLKNISINGQNTIYGDIADLPATITGTTSYVWVQGFNTITGNLANLPNTIRNILISGTNTIYGNIQDLPTTYLIAISIGGLNTISGSINAVVYAMNVLQYLTILGNNTIAGDLYYIPISTTTFDIRGSNVISDFSASRSWPTGLLSFFHVPIAPGGLSSAEVDALLISLSAHTWTTASGKQLYLMGTNAARTAASDLAVSILTSAGVTVTTH